MSNKIKEAHKEKFKQDLIKACNIGIKQIMAQYEHLECQPRKAKSLTRKQLRLVLKFILMMVVKTKSI
jgi:hypothetical protein